MFDLFDPQADFQITTGTNLPHWYQPDVTYFVTFRTEDSIPADISRRWHADRTAWLARNGIDITRADWRTNLNGLQHVLIKEYHETFSRSYLEAIDKGHGACVLKQPSLSRIVADALLYFDGERYHIGDFVVMPNHVHLIVRLIGNTEITSQCTSWKRFTARLINKELKTTGRFWQEESFDHLIRSEKQLEKIRHYIAANPANLPPGSYHLHQINGP